MGSGKPPKSFRDEDERSRAQQDPSKKQPGVQKRLGFLGWQSELGTDHARPTASVDSTRSSWNGTWMGPDTASRMGHAILGGPAIRDGESGWFGFPKTLLYGDG